MPFWGSCLNSHTLLILFLIISTLIFQESFCSVFLSFLSFFFFLQCTFFESEVAQPCPTLCDPMDCSLPGSSLHGILQARVLEWVAISFSRGSSQPRDRTLVSCIPGRHFDLWAAREVLLFLFSAVFQKLFYCIQRIMTGTWMRALLKVFVYFFT